MSERLIIENRTDRQMVDILPYVTLVVNGGRVSSGRNGKQYCYVTTWKDGTIVYGMRNKASDRIIVMSEERP